MDSTKHFVGELVREIPSLASLQAEHLKEFGEMLPHVLMGELTRYVFQLHNDSSGSNHIQDQSRLRHILDRLDVGFAHGEDAVKELIGVSFLESLSGEAGRESLRSLLGPTMSEALKQWD